MVSAMPIIGQPRADLPRLTVTKDVAHPFRPGKWVDAGSGRGGSDLVV